MYYKIKRYDTLDKAKAQIKEGKCLFGFLFAILTYNFLNMKIENFINFLFFVNFWTLLHTIKKTNRARTTRVVFFVIHRALATEHIEIQKWSEQASFLFTYQHRRSARAALLAVLGYMLKIKWTAYSHWPIIINIVAMGIFDRGSKLYIIEIGDTLLLLYFDSIIIL